MSWFRGSFYFLFLEIFFEVHFLQNSGFQQRFAYKVNCKAFKGNMRREELIWRSGSAPPSGERPQSHSTLRLHMSAISACQRGFRRVDDGCGGGWEGGVVMSTSSPKMLAGSLGEENL